MAWVSRTSIVTALLLGAALALDLSDKPVAKVVGLIKDLQAHLQKDADDDESVYDKFGCWCEVNGRLKTKAIAEAEQQSADLASAIDQFTAKSSQLNTDIAMTTKANADNSKALGTATSIREKEAAEFHEAEKDAVQAIGSVKTAVQTLSQHQAALPQEAMVQLQAVLQRHVKDSHQRGLLRQLVLAPHQQRLVVSFLQQTAAANPYQTNSGEIFGVLKQMQESFETNLANSQKEEATAQAEYDQLKSAKEQELSAGETMLSNKQAELGTTDEKLATSKEDNQETTEQLTGDREFLASLKDNCARMDKEFSERQAIRQEEMTSVSEALAILQQDDARDLFKKSTFVQMSASSRDAAVRAKASQMLGDAASRLQKPELSALAIAMHTDVFTKIKESIDLMVAQLKKETMDEVKLKDWCRDEFHSNEVETTGKYEDKDDVSTKIADLEAFISTTDDEIKVAQAEIADTQVQTKQAAENRQAANQEFQTTIAEQRETQAILAKAMERLQEFYSQRSLLQSSARQPMEGAPMPHGFTTPYKKSSGAGGVIGLIETIIAESKSTEAEAVAGENDGEQAYKKFLEDSKSSITVLSNKIINKQQAKAQAEEDLVTAKQDLASVLGDLDDLNTYNKELHSSCDYVLENFEHRQSARVDEIGALTQAKQIMSGADI